MIGLVFILAWVSTATHCDDDPPATPDPNAGFRIQTFARSQTNNVVFPTAAQVFGQFLQPNGSTTGTLESFNLSHSGVGQLIASGAKVPATWRLTIGPNIPGGGSLCLTFATSDHNVSLNSLVELVCPGLFAGFTASPDSLDALNPPATITFSGKGLDNAFGEPALAFYDEYGYVVASTQATQSLWVGDEIEGVAVTLPDISQVYDGVYAIAIHNIKADGTWELVGGSHVTIYGNPPPPPPPPPGGGGCEEPPPPEQPLLPCEPY
jgi:hypothetical protein